MSAEPARHLRSIHPGTDPVSGEVVPECPGCQERENEIEGLQGTIRSQAAKLRNLQRDSDAKARGDALWPKAHELFGYWLDHPRRRERQGGRQPKFTPDRFRLVSPFIHDASLYDCKRAIDGLYDSEWFRERKLDEFERPFSASQKWTAQQNFERFRDLGLELVGRFLYVAAPPSEGWLGSDYVMAQLSE